MGTASAVIQHLDSLSRPLSPSIRDYDDRRHPGRRPASNPIIISMSSHPLLLIQVGTPPDDVRAIEGDLPAWFGRALGSDVLTQ